jgi:hypothetical protein
LMMSPTARSATATPLVNGEPTDVLLDVYPKTAPFDRQKRN